MNQRTSYLTMAVAALALGRTYHDIWHIVWIVYGVFSLVLYWTDVFLSIMKRES